MSDRIPQDDAARKAAPMYRGLLGYFPAALFEVATHSHESNQKHNPGQEVHWARGKSTDHEDTIVRHLVDAGPRRSLELAASMIGGEPPTGSSALDARRYHLRCIAWRALAMLQEDCEACGAAPGVSSRFPPSEVAPIDQIKIVHAGPAETCGACESMGIRGGLGRRYHE